jgi:purine-binding chemotaxis protein CheW
VIPVIDLRLRFELPSRTAEEEEDARIVIIETEGITAGLIVDGVSEVLRLPGDRIDPPSQLVKSAESDCVIGIGRISGSTERTADKTSSRGHAADSSADRLIILIDVHKIVIQSADEKKALLKMQKAA